ncbi:MAG: hypothetical protein LBB53_02040 [Prevotellaceae bacterium]|jgi:hypothetical protein|nr:hypothetical protein [Prevotellaceae bacterium]
MFKITEYLKYKLFARHRKGFGVHSPFVFELLNSVFFEENPFYAFEKIEKSLQKNFSKIFFRRDVKYYRLIFRLTNYFSAKKMLIVGENICVEKYFLSVSKKNETVSEKKLQHLQKKNIFDIIFFSTHNIIYYKDVIYSPNVSQNTILIFENIYQNRITSRIWKEICSNNNLKVSIDIFKYGIVFFKNDFPKQHYLVKY